MPYWNRHPGPVSVLRGAKYRLQRVGDISRRLRPVEQLVSGGPAGELADRLVEGRQTLRRLLTSNIIPFWYPGVLDLEHGGYRLNHDLRGRWVGHVPKRLVSQARTLWFFSRLINAGHETEAYHEAASHGFAFLKDRLWDTQYGGLYWEIDETGATPTMPEKHAYGLAFALYALAEYVVATGSAAARELADELFRLFEDRFRDDHNGGYREFFARDWSEFPQDYIGYLHVKPDIKTLNTHLHILEAVTSYSRISKEPLVERRLFELISIMSAAFVRTSCDACVAECHSDWTVPRTIENGNVSYGHDVETVSLLIHAMDSLGLPSGPFARRFSGIFDNALRYGHDRRDGGFFYKGRYGLSARSRDKIWWVQAEGLLSALYMFRLTRRQRYARCFLRTLDWIVKYQVDWERGEWYSRIRSGGKALGNKADPWKSPYHNVRAVIECIRLIEEMLDVPAVGPDRPQDCP